MLWPATEQTLLMRSLTEESRGKARKKRKHGDTGSTTSGSTKTSGLSSSDAAFFKAIGLTCDDMNKEGCKDEELLLNWFAKDVASDYYDLVRDSKCDVGIVAMDRSKIQGLLEAITFEIIANTYSRDGKGPDLATFKVDMTAYDVPVLCAHKLFIFLKAKVDEMVKAQKESNADVDPSDNGDDDDDDDDDDDGN